MLTKLILWVVLSYGLMNIMVYGSIFKGLRDTMQRWGSNLLIPFSGLWNFISGILSCPMCFSTWGGFFLGIFVYSPTNELFPLPLYSSWFFDGIFSSGAVWAINAIVEWYEQNRPNQN